MAECKAIDVIALHSYASSGSVSAAALDKQLSTYDQTLQIAGAKGDKARLILQEWGAQSTDGNRTRQAEIFSAQVRSYVVSVLVNLADRAKPTSPFFVVAFGGTFELPVGKSGGQARSSSNVLGTAARKPSNGCLRLRHLPASTSTYTLRYTNGVADCALSSCTGCSLAKCVGGLA